MTRALRFAAVLLAALGVFSVEEAAAQSNVIEVNISQNRYRPASGDTYGLGEEIRIEVTFAGGSVLVSSDAKLSVQIGSTTRQFDCIRPSCGHATLGSSSWHFNYIVRSDDADTDGITVSGLTGGTITRSGGGSVSRTLPTGTGNRVDSANYKVDGSTGLGVTGVALNSPPVGDTFRRGERIEATVTFNQAADVTGLPQLSLGIGSNTRRATYATGHGTTSLVFHYTVVQADADADGISIGSNALVLNGGTIRLSGGTRNAGRSLAYFAISNSTNHKVSGSQWGAGVTGVDAVALNAPPVGDTFERDDVIEATVTFNQAVDVTGTPQLALGIGANTRQATYATGHGSTSLVFRYTVVQADADTDGISIAANALTLNSGTIRESGSTTNALLGLDSSAISNSTNHKVNGATLTAAAVNGASITSSPAGGGDTYGAGEQIEVEVTFTRAVDVVTTGGTPQLALSFDPPGLTGYTRQADYASGTGTNSLLFRYTAAAGDWDPDGLSVAASALTLNSGAINDARSASTAATLGLGTNAISDDTNHKVDGGPIVSGFSLNAPVGGSDTYAAGEPIIATATFNRAVSVTGAPQLALTVGTQTRQAAYYAAGSSSTALEFRYTVVSADTDGDGISIADGALDLNSGTINAADSGVAAGLALGALAVSNDANRKVDGSLVRTLVTGVALSSPDVGDTFEGVETIEATVTFSRSVDVTGTPQLALSFDPPGTTAYDRQADYATGSGSTSLVFRYLVATADADPDGISIGANALTLNSGTIVRSGTTDAASLGLGSHAISDSTNHKVSGVTVTSAAVNGASITSSPAVGDTYGAGEQIEVEVTFTRAVTVVTTGGTPQLALSFDPTGLPAQTRQAAYVSGSGSTDLLFRYTAAAGDWDPDGLSVGASALTLNSGEIEDARATGRIVSIAASLGLGSNAISDDTNHKVDGGPVVTGFSLNAPGGGSDTYTAGELITATATFNRAVAVTGAPQLALTVGTRTRQASYQAAGSSSTALVFRYTVASADTDADGISIADGALTLSGGTINAADSGAAAGLALGALAVSNDAARKVDGSQVRAVVTDVALDSPPVGDTFERGDVIEATVTFSQAVAVTGTPQLALTVGANTRQANFATGSGSTSLVFRYTVVQADADTDGISIGASALALNSGTIVLSGSTTAALLGLGSSAISNSTDHKVNGATQVAAAVNGASITSSPASGDTYGAGEVIDATVTFSRAVDVTGTPQLALTIGSTTGQANFVTGSGSTALVFRYVVAAGDWDADGLSVGASALTLNSGTINDGRSSSLAATLGLGTNAIANDGNHKVDGGPVMTGLSVNSPVSGDTFEVGDRIEVLVTFNRAVAVTGTPQLALTIGTATRQAGYYNDPSDMSTGSGTRWQAFHYTVVAADMDADGLSIAEGALALNGGAIRAADSGTDASLVLGARTVSNLSSRKVDGSQLTAAAPDRMQLESTPAASGTYGLGERIEVSVRFNRAVDVTGTPQLALTVGTVTRQADYATGSGTNELRFRYVVQGPGSGGGGTGGIDADADGISIGASALTLNGGEINDARSATAAASLGLTSYFFNNATGHAVDGTPAAVLSTGAVSITSSPASGGTYGLGEQIEVQVTFTRPVEVTGTPQLTLSVGTAVRQADYATGSGTTMLRFRYTVQGTGSGGSGTGGVDADTDGISMGPGALGLNGGEIKDAGGSMPAATLTIAVANAITNATGHAVDGSALADPAVSAVTVESAPPAGGTYGAGDPIRVRVRFDRAVRVTGAPTLTLVIGSQRRQAALVSGTGTPDLVFRYEVQAGDEDPDGFSVPADALALNGGSIQLEGEIASGTTRPAAALGLGSHALSDVGGQTVDAVPPPVEVAPDLMPTFGDARVPAQRYVQNMAIAPLTLPAASGGDLPLTYALTGPGAALVLPEGLAWSESAVTHPIRPGTLTGTPTVLTPPAAWTLTATDADGDTATLTFTIEVLGHLRERLKGINAAILPDLSRAMAASTVDAVAGRIGQALAQVGGASGPMASADMPSAFADVLQSNEGAIRDGTWSWKRGLDGRTFALTLSGAGGDGAAGMDGGDGSVSGGGARMTVWGAGDYRNLARRRVNGVDWDGHLFGGHLGVDARFGAGGLAGLALSLTEGRIDYTDTSTTVEGKYESRMTSAHPYLGWVWGTGTHAWASLGYGRGDITIIDGEAGRQKSDSRLRSAAAGGSVRVVAGEGAEGLGALTVDLKGEGVATWLEVEDNGAHIAGLGVKTNRLRVAAEGARAYALGGGGVFTPSMELGMRLDGGDGETGAGVELGGGVDYAHPARGLSAELVGRVLVAHAGGAGDWSVGGAVRMEPPSGLGLSLRVAPSYGEAGGGLSRLWEEGVAGSGAGTTGTGAATDDASASNGRSPAARLDAEMGYGLAASAGTLTPYGGFALSEGGAHGYRLGTRYLLGPAFEMSLEGERRESRTEPAEHSLMLRGRMRW